MKHLHSFHFYSLFMNEQHIYPFMLVDKETGEIIRYHDNLALIVKIGEFIDEARFHEIQQNLIEGV